MSDARTVPNLPDRLARFLNGRADGRSPDLTIRTLHTGDRYLLCSDRLSAVVPPARVRDTMRSIDDASETADRLVTLAIDHGGPDHITVVVIDVRDG
jgi:serine/threonine protein phosphatase PrpC